MHKLLPLLIIVAIFVIAVPSLKNGSQFSEDSTGAVQGRKTEAGSNGNDNGNGRKFFSTSIEKLEKVGATTRNNEVKSELNNIIEEQTNSGLNIETSIASMEARPKIIKFVMGPDYKNAGQVRSEVVHLQNQIRKLDKIEEKVGASESGSIAETKITLQTELAAIETRLYEGLQGFSLFGWLSRLLSGFIPTPSPTTSPVASFTPEASASATPFESATPSATPEVSETPTALPSATP